MRQSDPCGWRGHLAFSVSLCPKWRKEPRRRVSGRPDKGCPDGRMKPFTSQHDTRCMNIVVSGTHPGGSAAPGPAIVPRSREPDPESDPGRQGGLGRPAAVPIGPDEVPAVGSQQSELGIAWEGILMNGRYRGSTSRMIATLSDRAVHLPPAVSACCPLATLAWIKSGPGGTDQRAWVGGGLLAIVAVFRLLPWTVCA
jgi:hypothetical protein